MKRVVRLLSLLLCLIMVVSIISACTQEQPSEPSQEQEQEQGKDSGQAQGPDYLNPEGLPIVNEPITLKIMAQKKPLDADWNEMLIWKEMEKRTGIHVEWELPANVPERKNIVLASGDYPDAFFGDSVTVADIATYGMQGIFIPLNDLIDKYAPNLKSWMSKNSEIKRGITAPDGNIYSLPHISEVKDGWGFFINNEWLNNLNLKMPTTTDEFYQVLKAFKENDPNGNGKKDEIPLTLPANLERLDMIFKGSWGITNKTGGAYIMVDVDQATKEMQFQPIAPKYKEMLQYLNKLYTEGLIDPNLLQGVGVPEVMGATSEDLAGVVASYSLPGVVSSSAQENNWEPMPYQLTGPYGDHLWTSHNSSKFDVFLRDQRGFTITDKNKYPEATMKWADYLYSDEGAKLFMMGVEGETYYVDDQGKYRYTDLIWKNPEGLSPEEALGKYMPNVGIHAPKVWVKKYYEDNPRTKSIKTVKLFEGLSQGQYAQEERWPVFYFTKEENDKLISLKNDIETYVKEMRAQFISGKASFDQWDNYVNTIKQMGLDEYLNIYQAAYDRYEGN